MTEFGKCHFNSTKVEPLYFIMKIAPLWIRVLNEINLPGPFPILQLFSRRIADSMV